MKIPIKITINWEWEVSDEIKNIDWYLEELCLDDVIEDMANWLKKQTAKQPFTCYFCAKGEVERR